MQYVDLLRVCGGCIKDLGFAPKDLKERHRHSDCGLQVIAAHCTLQDDNVLRLQSSISMSGRNLGATDDGMVDAHVRVLRCAKNVCRKSADRHFLKALKALKALCFQALSNLRTCILQNQRALCTFGPLP